MPQGLEHSRHMLCSTMTCPRPFWKLDYPLILVSLDFIYYIFLCPDWKKIVVFKYKRTSLWMQLPCNQVGEFGPPSASTFVVVRWKNVKTQFPSEEIVGFLLNMNEMCSLMASHMHSMHNGHSHSRPSPFLLQTPLSCSCVKTQCVWPGPDECPWVQG